MNEHTHIRDERSDRPRRGRQAEAARNDIRVLEAAREVFGRHGAAATVAAVAEQAGVGIGSLYRRYGSKDDLLRHLCLASMQQSIEAAQDALAADDAWLGLAGYVRACVANRIGALAPLAGTIETTPEMWEASARGRQLVGELVARAQRGGTLRTDVTVLDIAWLIELFGRSGPEHEDDGVRSRLLSIALGGLRAVPGAEPLPGPPPDVADYVRRWSTDG
ncbi:MAG TPA: helix-turn-helix domain-containing protein [Actinocrinis sp.]|jgi:AcrR family transcriptional regulator